MSGVGEQRAVTVSQLDEKIDKKLEKYPTKWEVRCLIIVGLGLTQIVPSRSDIAQAATGLLPHVDAVHTALGLFS